MVDSVLILSTIRDFFHGSATTVNHPRGMLGVVWTLVLVALSSAATDISSSPSMSSGVLGEEASRPECFRERQIRRTTLDKNFMRLGRSDSEDLARNRNFIRFGRSGGAGNNFIRLGRSEEEVDDSSARGTNFLRMDVPRYIRNLPDRNFMRFGRSSTDLVRNGRQPGNLDRNFMRLGRGDAIDRVYRSNLDRNFMRFGRASDRNFIRFGRGSSNNFMRFGKREDEEDHEQVAGESRIRSKRSVEEEVPPPAEEDDATPAFLVLPFLEDEEGQRGEAISSISDGRAT